MYGKNATYARDVELMDPESRKTTIAPDLPRAYEGKNQVITDVILDLVAHKETWYLTKALPLTQTDQLSWRMNITSFDQRATKRVPHKATSRLLDSRRETRTGTLARSGIAYEMECQYVNTPEGQIRYAHHLTQMANAIIFTLCVGVIQAYLDSNDYRRTYEELHGIHMSSNVEALMRREISTFAIAQKQKNGMEVLDATITEAMTQWQGEADMWIVHPVMKTYLRMIPNEKTDYHLAGPKGPQNLEDAVNSPWSIGGVPAYISRMYDLHESFPSNGGVVRNMLCRLKEIGSYYTMMDTQKSASEKYFLEQYQSFHRTIRVYDEVDDDWRDIGLLEAMTNAHIFDAYGKISLPPSRKPYELDPNDKDTDFLSRVDPTNPTQRVPVDLFGHIDPRDLSPSAVVNACRTIVKSMAHSGAMDYHKLSDALSNGEALYRKICDAPFDAVWFWSIFVEHLKQNGKSGSFTWPNDASEKDFNALIREITKTSSRDKIPTRIMNGISGGAMRLPEKLYTNGLDDVNGGTVSLKSKKGRFSGGSRTGSLKKTSEGSKEKESEVERNEQDVEGNRYDEDVEITGESVSQVRNLKSIGDGTPFGGNAKGALAGYGSWRGFLALQRELSEGGSAIAGFTKGGYSIKDCEAADQFVKAVRALKDQLTFLFENPIYFDVARANVAVEDPTIEDVICEWVFGFGGLPVWLDVSKITNLHPVIDNAPLFKRFGMQLGNSDGESRLKIPLLSLIDSEDEKNAKTYRMILKSPIFDSSSESEQNIFKKFFEPFGETSGRQELDIEQDARLSKEYQSLLIFYPLRISTTPMMDGTFHFYRSCLLDFLQLFVFSRSEGEIDAAKSIFETLIEEWAERFGIRDFFKIARRDDELHGRVNVEAVEETTRGLKDMIRKDPMTPSEFGQLLKLSCQSVIKQTPSLKTKVGEFYSDSVRALGEVSKKDESIAQSIQKNKTSLKSQGVPVFNIAYYLVGLVDKKGIPGENWYGSIKSNSRASSNNLSMPLSTDARINIEGYFGSDISDDEGLRKLEDKNAERYVRTDLFLSPKQIEGLHRFMNGSDRVVKNIMNVRVSNPSNFSNHLSPSEIDTLVTRIKNVNARASSAVGRMMSSMDEGKGFADISWEPAYLFYPENKHARDRALARIPKEIAASLRPSSSDRNTARRFKRSRTDNYHDVVSRHYREEKTRNANRHNNDDMFYDDDDDVRDEYDEDEDFMMMESGGDRRSQMSRARRDMGLSSSHHDDGSNDSDLIDETVLQNILLLNDHTNSALLRVIGKIYLTSNIDRLVLEKFIRQDIFFPFGFVIFQPHKQYMMLMAIKTKGGRETGVTWVAHQDFMLQNDATTKTHFGHFNYYDQSVVYNEKNVYLAHNVFAQGVVGNGGGFDPIDPTQYDAKSGNSGGGACIYAAVPYDEPPFDWIMDVAGRFDIASDKKRLSNYVDSKRLTSQHYSSCWRTNNIWKIRKVGEVGAFDVPREQAGRNGAPFVNTRCVRGQQFNYDPATKGLTHKIQNQGHWGDYEYPGIKKGRNGELVQWKQGALVTIV